MKTIMISFMIPCSVSVFLILVSKLVEQKRTLVQKSNNLDFCLAFTAKPTASGGCGLRVGCEMKEELHWLMILNSQRKTWIDSQLLWSDRASWPHGTFTDSPTLNSSGTAYGFLSSLFSMKELSDNIQMSLIM